MAEKNDLAMQLINDLSVSSMLAISQAVRLQNVVVPTVGPLI